MRVVPVILVKMEFQVHMLKQNHGYRCENMYLLFLFQIADVNTGVIVGLSLSLTMLVVVLGTCFIVVYRYVGTSLLILIFTEKRNSKYRSLSLNEQFGFIMFRNYYLWAVLLTTYNND